MCSTSTCRIHAEDYVHRIGRTGRAGLEGHAFTIAMPEDRGAVEAIEKLIGHPIPPIDRRGSRSGRLGGGRRPQASRARRRRRRSAAAKKPRSTRKVGAATRRPAREKRPRAPGCSGNARAAESAGRRGSAREPSAPNAARPRPCANARARARRDEPRRARRHAASRAGATTIWARPWSGSATTCRPSCCCARAARRSR